VATENSAPLGSLGVRSSEIDDSAEAHARIAEMGINSEYLGLPSLLVPMGGNPRVEEDRQEKVHEQLSRLYSVPLGRNALDELVYKSGR
jgi:hypothetical protein